MLVASLKETKSEPSLDKQFTGHKEVVNSLSFRPNMTQCASGSNDGTVMIWNFKPGLRAFRFVGHKVRFQVKSN